MENVQGFYYLYDMNFNKLLLINVISCVLLKVYAGPAFPLIHSCVGFLSDQRHETGVSICSLHTISDPILQLKGSCMIAYRSHPLSKGLLRLERLLAQVTG